MDEGKICSRFGRIKTTSHARRGRDASETLTLNKNPHFRPSLVRSSPEIRAMTQPALPPCRVTARGLRTLAPPRLLVHWAGPPQAVQRAARGRPKSPAGPLGSNRQSFHPAVSKSALNRREMRADQNWPRGFGTLTGIRSSTFWQGRTRGTGPRCWRSGQVSRFGVASGSRLAASEACRGLPPVPG